MASGKVLVLDPSEVVLASARGALEAAGYDVSTLKTPFPLFEALYEDRPDVLVMEYDVPELRGDKILEILRAFGAIESLPVLLHTAMPEDQAAALVQRCGVDGYVMKSPDHAALLEQVQAAVERSHVQQGLGKAPE